MSVPEPDIKGRVAIITGASRGIGRDVALTLAKRGCHVVVAAKSVEPHPHLPGTIHTVAQEVKELNSGALCLPVKVDVRKDEEVQECIRATIEMFGRIDIVINNASALWWKRLEDTPTDRADLMMNVNGRGAFLMTKYAVPHMKKNGWGHVISMSPPIPPISAESLKGLDAHVWYTASKWSMTIVALGAAVENPGVISGNSLWPKTVIESLASENFEMGSKNDWRKARIISDGVLAILSQKPGSKGSSNMWIDEDLLRSVGVTDFKKYRYNPDVEPRSMADIASAGTFVKGRATKYAKGGAKL
mmetsp:Transcript_801/g.1188  ORF Transcript_801/g.1188 Transcript_801/m.1188 type:complete len:303 (+) Transcript_801:213-1121(+)